mgnify:CR=1 FL=1|jgi:hypothetical protein
MTMTAASDPLAGLTFAFAPLSGAVEHGLAQQSGSAQSRARWLLEAVVAGLARDGAPLALADLTLAQFDALLAAFYRVHYDDVMPAQARCGGCDEPFEISFRLSDVQARLAVGAADFAGDPHGALTAPSGRVFRLPRVADLAALDPARPEAWLRALLVDGPFDAEGLQDEIAQAGPVLSQDITAACPDCGHGNAIRFDLAGFLVQTLDGEAAFLWREVHLLARHYGWALGDILSLPRGVRRQLAGLIVVDAPRVRLAS